MKKLAIALVIALLATVVTAIPAMAWEGEAEVSVSDIDVSGDPVVGNTITFSGTVYITAYAEASGTWARAKATSQAWYVIANPDGVEVYSGGSPLKIDESGNIYLGTASANANQTYPWSQNVYLDMAGDWTAEQGGDAYYETKGFECPSSGECTQGQEWDESLSDSASNSTTVTVSARSGVVASTSYSHPYLVIQLPAGGIIYEEDHSRKFFTTDGWGDPTTEFIVYTDGIWQVEVAVGTAIQLDGSWHDKTWIEIDDQGNVIGRYGSDGSIIAEEIAFSQSITVTKVG